MRTLAFLSLALGACASGPTPEETFNLALSTRDPAQALKLLDRAIAARPIPEYFTARARLHLALHQRSEALADYGTALDGTPADLFGTVSRVQLLLKRALLYVSLGRAREADADLTEAIRLVPDYTEARLERALLLRHSGRGEEAERDLEAARQSGAGLADSFYMEGVRALVTNEKAEAERMIGFALDLDPGHSRAHVARARLYMESGRFEDAARELDQAIPVHPAEADLYYYRGTSLLAVGRAEPALQDFDKASELDPKEPRYLAARGLARFRAGQEVEAARADFNAALQVDPSCYPAWFNRGLVAFERKEFEDAEKDLRHATALRASPEGSIALGRVLQERGNTESALNLLRRALEIYRTPDAQKVLSEEIDRMQRSKEKKP